MLDHLISLYRQSETRGARWLAVEARQWLSQYSVSADDVAFTMGVKLHDYAMARAALER